MQKNLKLWLLIFLILNGAVIGLIGYCRFQYNRFGDRVNVRRFTTLTSDGITIGGIAIIPKNANASTPVVVICHGFTSFKERMLGQAYEFALHDMIGIAIDLRGHKQSTGKSTLGQLEWRDVSATLDWASKNLVCNASNAGCVGSSMGAVTSLMAGVHDARIQVVCESSAFANVSDLTDPAKSKFFEGTPDFLIERFDFPLGFRPIDEINTTSPKNLLVLHGTTDDAVPFSHGVAIFEKAAVNGNTTGIKEFYQDNWGHGIWYDDPIAWAKIITFSEKILLQRESNGIMEARDLTNMPNLYFYRALPCGLIAIIPLIFLLSELFNRKPKKNTDEKQRKKDGKYITENGVIEQNVPDIIHMTNKEAGILIIITAVILIGSALIDRLLVPVMTFSILNIMMPNLLVSIPLMIVTLSFAHKHIKSEQKTKITPSIFGLQWSPQAILIPLIILVYFLGSFNLGSYIAMAPFLLPKSTFGLFLIPFLLFFLGFEFAIRPTLHEWLAAQKFREPYKPWIVFFILVAISVGITTIIAEVYLTIKINLGILNPELLIMGLGAVANLFGAVMYHKTKNSLSGAVLMALIIVILFSALFPNF